MRVGMVCLHTDPYAPPGRGDVGGMNVVVRHVCEAMAAAGVEVEVITRHSDASVPRREEIDGVVTHRLPVGPTRVVPKGDHEALIEPFSRALAGLGPYDVLHSHHWFSGMAALPVARSWGVPHVQSFHSIAAPAGTPLAEGERPESPGRLMGEEYLAREGDAVVAVSNAEARTVIDRLGARPRCVAVVHPGVDTALFHPAAFPNGESAPADPCTGTSPTVPPARRPSLVVAARLEPLKGVDLAIRALAALPEPRPVLRVAGGATADGAFVDSLAELAETLGVADDVELLGPLSRCDLADLMRSATMVLVPSHSETYGLVALEASASGVPVVASVAGGLVEAVLDGVTGVLVPTRDPADWASTIGRLLADPRERDRLGASGRVHALQRRWDRVGSAVVCCYEAVLRATVG